MIPLWLGIAFGVLGLFTGAVVAFARMKCSYARGLRKGREDGMRAAWLVNPADTGA